MEDPRRSLDERGNHLAETIPNWRLLIPARAPKAGTPPLGPIPTHNGPGMASDSLYAQGGLRPAARPTVHQPERETPLGFNSSGFTPPGPTPLPPQFSLSTALSSSVPLMRHQALTPLTTARADPASNSPRDARESHERSGFGRVHDRVPPSAADPQRPHLEGPKAGPKAELKAGPKAELKAGPKAGPKTGLLTRICRACNLAIHGRYVRALSHPYHLDCFRCHDCGTNCAAKFFTTTINEADADKPPETPPNATTKATSQRDPPVHLEGAIILCEHDYFRRLNMLCHKCSGSLRGLYIVAQGRKYHLEHFTCTTCSRIFEKDENFYEQGTGTYCHYDYSKTHAAYCEGCKCAILKQFVEVFRRGSDERWHPECYMTHRYWNVSITPEHATLPSVMGNRKLNQLNLSREHLFAYEARVEEMVFRCWDTLTKFEGSTAGCISDMLRYSTSGNRRKGVDTAGLFIWKVCVLFGAVEARPPVPAPVPAADPAFSTIALPLLTSEPLQLTNKILLYLHHLSSPLLPATNKLLDLITILAHNLKYILRFALISALNHNKATHTTTAFDLFLATVARAETPPLDIHAALSRFKTPTECGRCHAPIETAAVTRRRGRYHAACVEARPEDVSEPALESLMALLRAAYVQEDHAVVSLRALLARVTPDIDAEDDTCFNELFGGEAVETAYSDRVGDVVRLRSERSRQRLGRVRNEPAAALQPPNPAAKAPAAKNAASPALGLAPAAKNAASPALGLAPAFTATTSRVLLNIEGELTRKRTLVNARTASAVALPDGQAAPDTGTLTLDDIPRIVAVEQARELHPNAFRHAGAGAAGAGAPYDRAYSVGGPGPSARSGRASAYRNSPRPHQRPAVYYSQLTATQLHTLKHVALTSLAGLLGVLRGSLAPLVPTKKPLTFWDKFKRVTPKAAISVVFGSPLEELTARYGVASDLGAGPHRLQIPLLIDELLTSLKSMDVAVEGIFRLNGNIKRLREMTEAVDADPGTPPDFSKETAIQLAALLKKFLREMPDPLMTFALYDHWMETFKRFTEPVARLRAARLLFCLLPQANRDLLEVLLLFFKWVGSFDEISKMNVHNLATVVSPTILYAKPRAAAAGGKAAGSAATFYPVDDAGLGDTYFYGIEIVNFLIELHQEICVVPQGLMRVLRGVEECAEAAKPKPAQEVSADPKAKTKTKIRPRNKSLGDLNAETLTQALPEPPHDPAEHPPVSVPDVPLALVTSKELFTKIDEFLKDNPGVFETPEEGGFETSGGDVIESGRVVVEG